MRPGFEERLGQYNSLAIDDLELLDGKDIEQLGPEAKELTSAINWTINNIANERRSDPDTQKEIYELQVRKQLIFQELRSKLAEIDSEVEIEQNEKLSVVTERDGVLSVTNKFGESAVITIGELITDIDWDNNYFLDPNTVSRNTRKKYVIEKAKTELRQLLDEQIYVEEVNNPVNDYKKVDAYDKLMEERNQELKFGHIIEKIIRNFWKKLEFDADIDFEIIDSDIYQDIEQKIDLIIRRKKHYRGVEIFEDPDETSLGIQVTSNTDSGVLKRKIAQLERVKQTIDENSEITDIALVKLSPEMSKYLADVYKYWKEMGEPPGGPDKLLETDFKERLFKHLLSGMFSEEEINSTWDNIAP